MVKKIKLTIVFFSLSFYSCFSQSEDKNPFVNISGSIGLHYDTYSFSEDNYPTFRARYPDNLFRLNANTTIQLGEHFSIPIGINITNQKTLYNLPTVPEGNIVDYISNPKNNISIHPEYKWVKTHIGTHTPNYSELTTGDINIFGGWIDLNPGKFILSANYGISQRAIEEDILFNTVGAYEQKIIAARIGFGKIDASKFTINIVKIKDDVNSLINTPINTKPIEGITIAPLIEVKFGGKIFLKTETAASVYTSDLLNSFDLDSDIVDSVKDIITVNASSKGDFSHVTSLDWKSKKLTLGGEVKYIGPGFVPAGFRNIERDILDYKIKTMVKLFKGKTSINGMFGVRTNNLQNTTLQSTKRIITNASVFSQITESLSINTSYANFGFNNNVSSDLLRIEMVNNTFTISPTYKFDNEQHNHQISANGNFNNFDQFDTSSAAFVASKSKSYSLNYNLMFKKMPLNVNVMLMHLNNETPVSDFKMNNYTSTISYKFMDKKISPSLSINVANISKSGFTKDKRVGVRLKSDYKINKKLKFRFSYRLNKYEYGSVRPNALSTENRLKFSLLKKF
jgi:hypothetical protein